MPDFAPQPLGTPNTPDQRRGSRAERDHSSASAAASGCSPAPLLPREILETRPETSTDCRACLSDSTEELRATLQPVFKPVIFRRVGEARAAIRAGLGKIGRAHV